MRQNFMSGVLIDGTQTSCDSLNTVPNPKMYAYVETCTANYLLAKFLFLYFFVKLNNEARPE